MLDKWLGAQALTLKSRFWKEFRHAALELSSSMLNMNAHREQRSTRPYDYFAKIMSISARQKMFENVPQGEAWCQFSTTREPCDLSELPCCTYVCYNEVETKNV